MNQVVEILSTDWHLKKENLDEIVKLVIDQCQLALKHNLNRIWCLGDVFDSRISQRIDVLNGFADILNICTKYKITLFCIPGNHDKTDYASEISFLTFFRFHPYFHLVENYQKIAISNSEFIIHAIPYFKEDEIYPKYLEQVSYSGKDLLFSHIALKGSRNNDGTLQDNLLLKELFKRFSRIYLGHYHNWQEVWENAIHIPSIKQHNFGENSNKGFTLLDADGNYEIYHTNFKKYIKHVIEVEKYDYQSLKKKLDQDILEDSDSYVQVVFVGDRNRVSKIDLQKYNDLGVIIKYESEVKSDQSTKEVIVNQVYKVDDIQQLFEEFCASSQYDFKLGLKYLIAAIKRNSLS